MFNIYLPIADMSINFFLVIGIGGMVAFIADAAEKHPVLYGLCAVLIALGAGLTVGFIFKGGGH